MAKTLDLDQQLCFAVYAAGHAFNRFYKSLLGPVGLSYPQYLVLLALWQADGQAVRAIGDRLGLDSGTLTPLLKRMEAAGWVSRARKATDERQVIVTLTAKAKQFEAEAATFPGRIGRAANCSAAELEGIRATLCTLRLELDAAAAA